jgi:nitrogen PTS system EIIA component
MNTVTIVRSAFKLAEVFPPEAILVGIEGRTKVKVIEKLVRHAVALEYVPQSAEEALVRFCREREEMGTTALGNGIAFPHCRSSFAARFVGVAGLLNSRIPFDAVDAEPVDSVFLVLAPRDQRERFFEILGRLVAIGRDKSLGVLLRGCRTAEHVSSFLQELDQPGFGAFHVSENHQASRRSASRPPHSRQPH